MRHQIRVFWKKQPGESEVLFTCNRVEVYAAAKDLLTINRNRLLFKNLFSGVFGNAYVNIGNETVLRHFLRVATGLESQFVGEAQIVNQLEEWMNKEGFSDSIKTFLKEALDRGREIRKSIDQSENLSGEDIADVVIKDAAFKLNGFSGKKLIVIGTGKIAQLFGEKRIEGADIYFASRKKHSRVRQISEKAGGQAILMKELGHHIETADVIVSATSSPHYILKEDHIREPLNKRETDLHMYDLAVPRDIEPSIGKLQKIHLKNIDDLNIRIKERNDQVREYVSLAENLIENVLDDPGRGVGRDAYKSRNTVQFTGA